MPEPKKVDIRKPLIELGVPPAVPEDVYPRPVPGGIGGYKNEDINSIANPYGFCSRVCMETSSINRRKVMKIAISSGHSKYVSGACGIINEVEEARKVAPRVAELLRYNGVEAVEFHDDNSHTQRENLNAIVDFHNTQTRDLDVSVHFNAYSETDAPCGVEVLFFSQDELAEEVSLAIANASGLKNRGAKKRGNLAFLKNTKKPAILIEVCFVDSTADVNIYRAKFEEICCAIASSISGKVIVAQPQPEPHEPSTQDHYNYLRDIGVEIDETRFDDPVTRGELFALLARYDRATRRT